MIITPQNSREHAAALRSAGFHGCPAEKALNITEDGYILRGFWDWNTLEGVCKGVRPLTALEHRAVMAGLHAGEVQLHLRHFTNAEDEKEYTLHLVPVGERPSKAPYN